MRERRSAGWGTKLRKNTQKQFAESSLNRGPHPRGGPAYKPAPACHGGATRGLGL